MDCSLMAELVTYLAFSTLYLISIAIVMLLLYVSGTLVSFFFLYLRESVLSSGRPPLSGTILHKIIHFNTLSDYFTELARKHKTYRMVDPTHCNIYTTDPANIEYFLKTNFSNYTKGYHYTILNDLFGDGIFAVDGEKWQHQRKLASYEFSTKVLRDFSTVIFREKAAKLANKIADFARTADYAVDLQELLMKTTMDSIFKVGFGVELDTLEGTDDNGIVFSKAFDESNHIMFCRYVDIFWKAKRFLNVGLEAQLRRNLKVIDDFVFHIIHRKKKQMENKSDDNVKGDILSRFLLASQNDSTMNDGYLRDIILNFLIAGKDTTANTLSWFFYMLCKNPQVEQKIMAEINENIEFESGGSIHEFVHRLTEEVLIRLSYLHAALAETLRLFPVVPLDGKFVKEDDELPDGNKVKKGEGIYYLTYAMGRMTDLWGEDAEEFKPERWLINGVFQHESPFKFVSFNAGPRICLGKDFAYRQMKIMAATLLHFFKFKLQNHSGIGKYKAMLTLHMQDGLPVIPVLRFSTD